MAFNILIGLILIAATMPGSDAQDLWTVDKSRLGKRPDCTPIKVKSTATTNYLYQTTAKCKEKCVEETEGKCNFISRYQQSNKNDESLWHCRFYTCPDPSNVNYVDQTSWGNGAGQSYLLKIMSRHYQVVDTTTTTTTASCDKINYINKTIINYVNRTNYMNKTNYVDQYRDIINYINKTIVNYINKINYVNETTYVKQYYDIIRYINKTNILNITQNETIYIEKFLDVIQYIERIRYTNVTRYNNITTYLKTFVTKYLNKTITNYVNKTITNYVNKTITNYVNKTIPHYVNKTITRYINKTIYIYKYVNATNQKTIQSSKNDDDNDGDQQFPEPNSIQYGSSSKSAIVPNQRNRTENDNVKKTKQEPDTVSVIILCLICFIIGFLSAVIVYYIMNMCSDCFKCIIKTNKRDTKDDSSKKSSSKPDKLNLKPDNYEHDYELGITKSTNNLSTFNTIKPILTSLKRSISKEFNNSPFNMHHKKSKKTPPPWPCKNENNKNTDNIDNLATASVIRIQI